MKQKNVTVDKYINKVEEVVSIEMDFNKMPLELQSILVQFAKTYLKNANNV